MKSVQLMVLQFFIKLTKCEILCITVMIAILYICVMLYKSF